MPLKPPAFEFDRDEKDDKGIDRCDEQILKSQRQKLTANKRCCYIGFGKNTI
jgi:hypothetical protein